MSTVSHLIALLILKYDIEFAPGDDGTRVTRDIEDNFTMNPGQLNLVFRLRDNKKV